MQTCSMEHPPTLLLAFLIPLPPLANPPHLLPMDGPPTWGLVDILPLRAAIIQSALSIRNHFWGATGAIPSTGGLAQEVII